VNPRNLSLPITVLIAAHLTGAWWYSIDGRTLAATNSILGAFLVAQALLLIVWAALGPWNWWLPVTITATLVPYVLVGGVLLQPVQWIVVMAAESALLSATVLGMARMLGWRIQRADAHAVEHRSIFSIRELAAAVVFVALWFAIASTSNVSLQSLLTNVLDSLSLIHWSFIWPALLLSAIWLVLPARSMTRLAAATIVVGFALTLLVLAGATLDLWGVPLRRPYWEIVQSRARHHGNQLGFGFFLIAGSLLVVRIAGFRLVKQGRLIRRCAGCDSQPGGHATEFPIPRPLPLQGTRPSGGISRSAAPAVDPAAGSPARAGT
jgi:hypothetical protein